MRKPVNFSKFGVDASSLTVDQQRMKKLESIQDKDISMDLLRLKAAKLAKLKK